MKHDRRTFRVKANLSPRRVERLLAGAPLNVELIVRSALELIEEDPRPSMALADRVCAHHDELLFAMAPHHGTDRVSDELRDLVCDVSSAMMLQHVDTIVDAVEQAPAGARAPNVVHVDFRTRTVGTSKQSRGRSA